jgi:hypothetical protein
MVVLAVLIEASVLSGNREYHLSPRATITRRYPIAAKRSSHPKMLHRVCARRGRGPQLRKSRISRIQGNHVTGDRGRSGPRAHLLVLTGVCLRVNLVAGLVFARAKITRSPRATKMPAAEIEVARRGQSCGAVCSSALTACEAPSTSATLCLQLPIPQPVEQAIKQGGIHLRPQDSSPSTMTPGQSTDQREYVCVMCTCSSRPSVGCDRNRIRRFRRCCPIYHPGRHNRRRNHAPIGRKGHRSEHRAATLHQQHKVAEAASHLGVANV